MDEDRVPLDADRVAEAELERIVRVIVERFDPETIVLFGSRAEGRAAPDSDADLLVVMRTALPFYERAPAIRDAIWPHDLGLDLLVFTPEEVVPLESDPVSFVGGILRTGRVLHRRRAA
ncbi:MAG TPA: nucleotidyltransferase domain-containing protein [Planctomycetota bacterium]|nr:nucleotidyltransferase domain-containing protein [Planctomycetota bacterium]